MYVNNGEPLAPHPDDELPTVCGWQVGTAAKWQLATRGVVGGTRRGGGLGRLDRLGVHPDAGRIEGTGDSGRHPVRSHVTGGGRVGVLERGVDG